MRMIFFTGSYPPDRCGVGDYTAALAGALVERGIQIEILRHRWRSVLYLLFLRKRRDRQVALNIQYPTAGYGKSLSPHLAGVVARMRGIPTSVTIHEYSSLNRRARMAGHIFFHVAHRTLFTSATEQAAAIHECPMVSSRSGILPIGINVPSTSRQAAHSVGLCYFGNIVPGKGIETFLSVAAKLPHAARSLIGATTKAFQQYAEDITRRCEDLGIEVILNSSLKEVSQQLARTCVALLPFPDGISMRRGSALAAMANGAVVVSTKPNANEEFFEELAYCCASESTMVEVIQAILVGSEPQYELKVAAAQHFADQRSWAIVAEQFLRQIDFRQGAIEHENC